MIMVDAVFLSFAGWASYALRFGVLFQPSVEQWGLILFAPIVAIPVFVRLGLYRSVIRYVGEQALWAIVKGMTMATTLWAGLAFMAAMTGIDGMPRAVPIIYWLLGVVLVAGARFTARRMFWAATRKYMDRDQVLIYGAGEAGRQVARSLREARQLFPVGFLDDDAALHGKDVDGLRVYAPTHLPVLIEKFGIREVIITIPSASAARRREILLALESLPVRVRTLPALTDIVSGKHLVSMVREVDIGELLGRESVSADPRLLRRCIASKVVLVTGAGGSIGSELCRQVVALSPAKLVMLEANEHALYQIDRELRRSAACELVACLASVRDEKLLVDLLRAHGVQTVYHAAAYKHVPLVEANVLEAAKNNILGTESLARSAYEAGVETFVLISTDKAVRPTSVMGATKRWAEKVVQSYADRVEGRKGQPVFCAVRFGNVLGSSGSVVPLFKEQIASGGPVTVTHPEVTRFFMSIHEAVGLVIQAGSMAEGGEIFLLDMGEPVKIIDMARKMIQLAGYSVRDAQHPDGDIEIVITGLRPGEKLYEELLIDGANAEGTDHPQIMKARERQGADTDFELQLRRLRKMLEEGDRGGVRRLLLKEGEDDSKDRLANEPG